MAVVVAVVLVVVPQLFVLEAPVVVVVATIPPLYQHLVWVQQVQLLK